MIRIYIALYRKYRPRSFADVIGQEAITTALQNQVETNRIGHAYIFTGTRGTGKTSCAKIFAKAINCPHAENGEPCGVCEICKGITDGSIFDVVEIDAASNNGVDDIRELREETAFVPAACKYKVYIIDEVHMLSQSAFNALLKIMEEPPKHIVFILATTEIHKVPATILSRCQRFDFHRIPAHLIANHVSLVAEQENIKITKEAAFLIARLADGAVRDALSLLDTCITTMDDTIEEETVRKIAGVADKAYLFTISDAIREENAEQALILTETLLGKSVEVKRLTEELIYHYRNILLAGFASVNEEMLGAGAEYFEQYQENAKSTKKTLVVQAIKILGAALDKIGKGTDPRIELEIALLSLCEQNVEPSIPVQKAASKASKQAPVKQTQPSAKSSINEASKNVALQEQVKESIATEETQLFAEWVDVIDKMQGKDKLLYAHMRETKAYKQGRRILIDGNEVFMEYMRQNDYSTKLLKETIEEITGEKYALGPHKKKEVISAPEDEKPDGIVKLEQFGVPIEYI